jgi:hypothetical protein
MVDVVQNFNADAYCQCCTSARPYLCQRCEWDTDVIDYSNLPPILQILFAYYIPKKLASKLTNLPYYLHTIYYIHMHTWYDNTYIIYTEQDNSIATQFYKIQYNNLSHFIGNYNYKAIYSPHTFNLNQYS